MSPASHKFLLIAGLACVFAGAPALADVKQGVDAWSAGDYTRAVAEWQAPAAAGDADAMFNLGQAYRLGRGVAQDDARAMQLYRQATAAGHVQAADTLGLMLFQNGQRAEALPYVQAAARRGDPRSQYLLGLAHFNGDGVEKDWVRGYALLTLANASGLPQAAPAIAQMDEHVPLDQRQKAAGLARQMEADAEAARAAELAAADLGSAPGVSRNNAAENSAAPAPAILAQARDAVVSGSPQAAGASYARAPGTSPAVPVSAPVSSARTATVASPTPRANGPWRVQLGAFSVRSNADGLWSRLSARPELEGHAKVLVSAGRVTKLQAGGFASQAQAEAACNRLKSAGHDCLVTRN